MIILLIILRIPSILLFYSVNNIFDYLSVMLAAVIRILLIGNGCLAMKTTVFQVMFICQG